MQPIISDLHTGNHVSPDNPGMILAQLYPYELKMVVGYIRPTQATALQKALGMNGGERGATITERNEGLLKAAE